MGKKPINQSIQKELSWYLSTLEILQEGIEMVKQQREMLELPIDLSIDLVPPKKKEDLMVVVQKVEAQLRRGEKGPIIYLYTKLAVDHFRELERYIQGSNHGNRELKKFSTSSLVVIPSTAA